MFEADRIGGIDLASQDSPHFTLQEMGLCRPARKQLAQIDLKKRRAQYLGRATFP
jgi:hypothetical protein